MNLLHDQIGFENFKELLIFLFFFSFIGIKVIVDVFFFVLFHYICYFVIVKGVKQRLERKG